VLGIYSENSLVLRANVAYEGSLRLPGVGWAATLAQKMITRIIDSVGRKRKPSHLPAEGGYFGENSPF
jgi:hypothetical protein